MYYCSQCLDDFYELDNRGIIYYYHNIFYTTLMKCAINLIYSNTVYHIFFFSYEYGCVFRAEHTFEQIIRG